ncbi:A/G-specific adenine glycosylase [Sphingosinicella sp. CPCC 101087]|uniref:A/G-specific adenine glycosylase n=1 Tax=Sphingosinicella sp. CPCC 101087 TaxID=2497754 RepID=UPI00101CB82B|nr:A/G-specific adenine glycosylase [Sphingosinicella sp. CPCC 101087]
MPVDACQALLCWYAVDKRSLPWRAGPGKAPDPYRVWLSEVMLQQTTIAHARPYFETFVHRWPTVEALAAESDGEVMAAWAGLGYYARARNLLACARIVADQLGGRFPEDEAALRRLPGIGAYTAAAVAAIAFGRRAVAVDANVERVVARLFAVEAPLPSARAAIRDHAERLTPEENAGDFVQAMMELGQTVCMPRRPDCGRCPLTPHCAGYAAGDPGAFPVKAPKAARPRREGVAYWLEHRGRVLLVRRPQKGLLGGMLALPTDGAPAEAAWREAGAVDHVFTHFALTMRLLCAETDTPAEGIWWPVERIGEAGLPTLFAKLAVRGSEWRRAA